MAHSASAAPMVLSNGVALAMPPFTQFILCSTKSRSLCQWLPVERYFLASNGKIFSLLSASIENLHDRDAHLQGVYRAMAIGLFCALPVNACIFLVSEAQKRGSQSDLGLGQRQLNHMDDESLRLSCYWGVIKEACVVCFYVFFQQTNKPCVSNKFAMNRCLPHNTISTRCAASSVTIHGNNLFGSGYILRGGVPPSPMKFQLKRGMWVH